MHMRTQTYYDCCCCCMATHAPCCCWCCRCSCGPATQKKKTVFLTVWFEFCFYFRSFCRMVRLLGKGKSNTGDNGWTTKNTKAPMLRTGLLHKQQYKQCMRETQRSKEVLAGRLLACLEIPHVLLLLVVHQVSSKVIVEATCSKNIEEKGVQSRWELGACSF